MVARYLVEEERDRRRGGPFQRPRGGDVDPCVHGQARIALSRNGRQQSKDVGVPHALSERRGLRSRGRPGRPTLAFCLSFMSSSAALYFFGGGGTEPSGSVRGAGAARAGARFTGSKVLRSGKTLATDGPDGCALGTAATAGAAAVQPCAS